MAARTAVVRAVEIVRGDDRARAGETTTATKVALVSIDNGSVGSVVGGGTDTLDCDLAAAIAGVVRNGRTITVRGACVVGAAMVAGVAYGATSSLSSNTISLSPTTTNWSSTGTLPIGPASANDRPYMVAVGYSEA